jgi:GNAT superfamily N-acetyltransferase
MKLMPATDGDLAAVAILVNSSYRGETSRQGWTTEADYLDGQRTNEDRLRADIAAKPGARLLVLRDDGDDAILGCVWLEPAGDNVWYLGLLTVRPDLQDRRIGRELLGGGEDFARGQGARRMRMTVVHLRDTLIAWYGRRGYTPTGETLPFIYADPPRDDLRFVVLERDL